MERRRKENPGMGHLPDPAPLANPYVPFQCKDPETYDARKGLIRGTLFPGLDLPFMGKVNQRELCAGPMSDLQTMHFALQELALYLDTHRTDREALELYRTYQKMYHDAAAEFSRTKQPMNHTTPVTGEYSWLDDPWPWEYCHNKEV